MPQTAACPMSSSPWEDVEAALKPIQDLVANSKGGPSCWLVDVSTNIQQTDSPREYLSESGGWNGYTPVIKHSNGKSPFSIGNTSSKGPFPHCYVRLPECTRSSRHQDMTSTSWIWISRKLCQLATTKPYLVEIHHFHSFPTLSYLVFQVLEVIFRGPRDSSQVLMRCRWQYKLCQWWQDGESMHRWVSQGWKLGSWNCCLSESLHGLLQRRWVPASLWIAWFYCSHFGSF